MTSTPAAGKGAGAGSRRADDRAAARAAGARPRAGHAWSSQRPATPRTTLWRPTSRGGTCRSSAGHWTTCWRRFVAASTTSSPTWSCGSPPTARSPARRWSTGSSRSSTHPGGLRVQHPPAHLPGRPRRRSGQRGRACGGWPSTPTDPHEREHVTLGVYRRPDRFSVANVRGDEDLSDLRWTVDNAGRPRLRARASTRACTRRTPRSSSQMCWNSCDRSPPLSRTSMDAERNAALKGLDTGAMDG